MPITIQWFDTRKIVLVVHYKDNWTWQDFHVAVQSTRVLMKSVDHPVVIIHDSTEGHVLPPGNVIEQAKIALAKYPPNLAYLVVVAQSATIRTFVGIIKQLSLDGKNKHIQLVDKLETAFEFVSMLFAHF